MKTPATLGEFEQVVLLAILRLDKEAYGVSIRAEIAACTRREPAPGALYTTLDRMEDKGLVRSWLSDPTPQRGGRAKRYFSITKAGRTALVRAQLAYQNLLEGLDLLRGANAYSFNR
jgi:PadR family transcriptional regulator, regulatory protein PadR